MEPFKIKKVQIYGVTKAQREEQLEKIKSRFTKRGWTFIKYQNSEGLKGAIDGSTAEFHRLQSPSLKNILYDWYDDKKIKIWLALISLLTLSSFYAFYQIAEKSNERTLLEAQQRRQQFEVDQKIKIKNAEEVATSLKNFLRNNGVNSALIADVKADEFGVVVLVVTNSWLDKPKYEQKQMRQIIERSLQKIVPPDGWRFYIVDYLGNRI